MRWAAVAVGFALVVVATTLTWFRAEATNGSAVMYGWGGWSAPAGIDAALHHFPVAVLVYLPAAWLVASAVRRRFGQVALAGSLVAAVGLLTGIGHDWFAGHRTGGGGVYVVAESAPPLVLGLGLVAMFLGWFLYSRAILRPRPTA